MDVHELLRRYDIHPSKGLGQNLLVAEWAYERIIEASALTDQDHVLEIGPGLGTLTWRLAERAGHVTAVELDKRMVAVLQDTLSNRVNISIVQGDILDMPPDELAGILDQQGSAHYKVVANIPYYITSRILRHVLTAAVRPNLLTLMVQKEVADRIVAQPGKMSLLAVSVQAYGEAARVCVVPPGAFYPRPKVSSAILTIRTHATPLVPAAIEGRFFDVVRAGFQQRRKQLHNSLVANLPLDAAHVDSALDAAGIAPALRPQALDVHDWIRLTTALYPDTTV